MTYFSLVGRLACFFAALSGIALSGIAAPAPPACEITVSTKLVGGREVIRVFPSKSAKTEAICARQANLHRTNFDPSRITAKKVTYRWLPRGAR